MKTVFKEGMEVYDQLNFPNKKGVIVEISNDENDPYPVEVSFENEAGRNYYTPEGRFSKKHIPTLSTKPYKIEFQGFEQKEPAPTYDKALDWLEKNSKDRVIYADEAYINEEYERAFEALKKLTILREYYNKGWQPDWESSKGVWKHSIVCYEGNICKDLSYKISRILTFRTKEIRDKFLEEQRELLETAKPLL